jgi:hypothetical protein
VCIPVALIWSILLLEGQHQLGIQRFVDAKRLSESPAATLSISHPNIVEEYCVSVDLAPLVETHLPFIQKFGWPVFSDPTF